MSKVICLLKVSNVNWFDATRSSWRIGKEMQEINKLRKIAAFRTE